MPLERITLLTETWIDRYTNLLPRKDIAYVMPFENRGEECGVTLHHPHGQIYCYPFIPPVIEKEVSTFKEGDEVTFGSWGNGAFSDYVIVPENGLQLKSKSLDFKEAASFQTAYMTAYVSLVRRGELKPKESLLVHGATGGVGMAAVQLGQKMGANVIATGTSENKLKETLNWGASHYVLTHQEGGVSFRQEVKDLTEGKGADVIYDPVGGDVFDESIRCINWGGRILVVGFTSGRIPTAPVNMPLIKGFSIVGVRAGEFGRRDPVKGKENIEAVKKLADEGDLKPHICKTFKLEEAKEAIKFLSERKLVEIGRASCRERV